MDNTAKYGTPQNDLIAQAYEEGYGHQVCSWNARKYLTRFVSKDEKAGNKLDLEKARDYINRMIEMC